MDDIIVINNLRKRYMDIEAVKGISLTVKKGSFFSFLGENGAGKSTTINILSTLLKKTSGEIIINQHLLDEHDHEIRKDIGIVFQEHVLDPFLTVTENILNRGKLYGLTKKEITRNLKELKGSIEMEDIMDRRYGQLSGGQKRRADLVRALIHQPKILILDEPTTGLDPFTRKNVWEVLQKIRMEREITLFLTTHYMEEAAGSDYITIIDAGEIKAAGTPEQLRIQYSTDRLNLLPRDRAALCGQLEAMGLTFKVESEKVSMKLGHAMEAINIIHGVRELIESFEVIRGNMDDVFIEAISGKYKGGKENFHGNHC